jgi:hypothetical protein
MYQLSEAARALTSQTSAFQRLQDSMNPLRFDNPFNQLSEAARALTSQTSAFQRLHDSMNPLRFDNPFNQLSEAARALLGQDSPITQLQKSINAISCYDSTRSIQQAVETLGLDKIIDAVSQERWPEAFRNYGNDFVLTADGAITVDAKTFTYEEIRNVLTHLLEKADDAPNQFDKAITSLIAEIRTLKDSSIQKIVTLFLYPLIVGLLLTILHPFSELFIKQALINRREITKDIKKQAIQTVGNIDQLKIYRIIKSERLNIRSEPSSKAPILGTLTFGQVVLLLEKDKNWSLVAWSDENNRLKLQGWVFSRYLEKFN